MAFPQLFTIPSIHPTRIPCNCCWVHPMEGRCRWVDGHSYDGGKSVPRSFLNLGAYLGSNRRLPWFPAILARSVYREQSSIHANRRICPLDYLRSILGIRSRLHRRRNLSSFTCARSILDVLYYCCFTVVDQQSKYAVSSSLIFN